MTILSKHKKNTHLNKGDRKKSNKFGDLHTSMEEIKINPNYGYQFDTEFVVTKTVKFRLLIGHNIGKNSKQCRIKSQQLRDRISNWKSSNGEDELSSRNCRKMISHQCIQGCQGSSFYLNPDQGSTAYDWQLLLEIRSSSVSPHDTWNSII